MSILKRFSALIITTLIVLSLCVMPLNNYSSAAIVETTTSVIETEEETTTTNIAISYAISEYIYADYICYERMNVTQSEIDLMARVVMSESSILSYECKVAIAETIINRVLCPKFPNTIYEVVYSPNQYSTQNNGDVTEECYQAVYQALSGVNYCSYMFYFRESYYHTFAEDYMNIDNMYFSIGTWD